jgi:hypothetical protein
MRLLWVFVLSLTALADDRPKAALTDFAWLEGRWAADLGPGRMAEETYSKLAGGSITSMFRMVNGDKTSVVELCTITEAKDGIELRIRHFDTALVPWEKGDPIVLRLVSWDGKKAVFENFVHNKPKRSSIDRVEPNQINVLVETVNADGTPRNIDLKMRREK